MDDKIIGMHIQDVVFFALKYEKYNVIGMHPNVVFSREIMKSIM